MNRLLVVLWAFVATTVNDFVLTAPAKPLSFKRPDGEYRLIHLDYDRPGWAVCHTPTNERTPTMLTDKELGVLFTAYGEATGTRIQLPNEVTDANEQAASASAGGAGIGHS
jgi:hypothetical protein